MDDSDLGFFHRCLNHAWINGGIPADPKERARVLRTRLDTANKRWLRVGKCWIVCQADNTILVNSRQEIERKLAIQISQVRSESAKRRSNSSANAQHARAVLDSDPDSDTKKNPQTPAPQAALARSKKRDASQIGDALGPERTRWWMDFWKIFPCHDGKVPAMDAFERKIKTPELWDACRSGAHRYAQKARSDPDMKLKYGQGWINDCRWEDEISSAVIPFSAPNGKARSFADDVKSGIQRNLERDGKPW